MTKHYENHIELQPEICGGAPVIKGAVLQLCGCFNDQKSFGIKEHREQSCLFLVVGC